MPEIVIVAVTAYPVWLPLIMSNKKTDESIGLGIVNGLVKLFTVIFFYENVFVIMIGSVHIMAVHEIWT